MKGSIYLDGAANTPMDKAVFKAMKPYMTKQYVGNSAGIHEQGIKSAFTILNARDIISDLLGVETNEVLFTSGATESNNWVIKSLALNELTKPESERKMDIVVSAIEHSSVINACKDVEKLGFKIHYIQPKKDGRIYINNVEKVVKPIFETVLLAIIMAVNNETGVENDIPTISKYLKKKDIPILVDCTQALTYGGDYVSIGSKYKDVDYMSFSSHKIYGPTGVGCLIVRSSASIYPFISGGIQERGLRGGTSNVSGIVGTAKALHLMAERNDERYFTMLFEELIRGLSDTKAKVNTLPDHKNIVSLNFSQMFDKDNLASFLSLNSISCSAGSACDNEHFGYNPSHVLVSMGLTEKIIRNTIRISFTKYTTVKDIQKFCKIIKKLVTEE